MCRLLTYIGKEVNLHSMIYTPEHSIVKQSYQPKEMRSGVVNADGFGVGWYRPEIDDSPAVFKSAMPIWSDLNLLSISRKIFTPCALVHVRGASRGMAIVQTNSHPFAKEKYLFMHNGVTENFRSTLMRVLRRQLLDEDYAGIEGTTDSEHIFALFLSNLHRDNGQSADMAECLLQTIDQMLSLAQKFDSHLVLNIALSDGETNLVTNFSTFPVAASLYFIENPRPFPQSVLICSERLFQDSAWQPVPQNHFIRARKDMKIEVGAIKTSSPIKVAAAAPAPAAAPLTEI
ncbi:MAG: ergothioneine biosynthesis protein EgtC [bacterium]